MHATCARAVALGVSSLAFTEHVDHTVWHLDKTDELPEEWLRHGVDDRALVPPPLDMEGYLESIDRCRTAFPTLRILTGVELGEPHWHTERVRALLDTGAFRRVLASVHSSRREGGAVDVGRRYADLPPHRVVTEYLEEVARLLEGYDDFEILAHIDYPLRRWPSHERLCLADLEEQYRHVLGLLSGSGRVLEINTRVPLPPTLLRWWHDVGGQAVSFASDAHSADGVAAGFRAAMAMAEAVGFRRADPGDFWRRS